MSPFKSDPWSQRPAHSTPFALAFSFLAAGIGSFSSMAYSAWFEDTTAAAGVEYRGPSFGASWGDLNGDGWADLWVGNHGQEPDLFQNNRDGTFSRVPLTIQTSFVDMHGAAWADFDNDGDQDLFFEVGAQSGTGVGPNQLLVNTGNIFTNKAVEYGVDYPFGRGRTPLWLDWNADGKLDLLISNDRRSDGLAPTALFSQSETSFSDSAQITGLSADSNSSFAQLIHMFNRAAPVLLINGNPFPNRAYDLGSAPFFDLNGTSGTFPPLLYNVDDAAIADFDGNLLSDVFVTRLKTVSQLLSQQNPVLARINTQGDEKGFSLGTSGDIEIEVNPPFSVSPSNIFIGRQGAHPSGLAFTLSPQDSAANGITPHTAGTGKAVFIGYDAITARWEVLVSSADWFDVNFTITSGSPVTDATTIGFSSSDGALPDKLLTQTMSGFSDSSVQSGVASATSCTSVIAEDLDNDMDVDLYLACHGPIENAPNILLENTGNGVFRRVTGAGGAEGTSDGRSESVVAADYDNDGFIDLFVTNGDGAPPFSDGPSQLFRNLGNSNHWIGIDLEGRLSNRDGIASTVLLTAGGITQLREQNGGMHKHAQNHQRLHFGLGRNTSIDRIDVTWPAGTNQTLRHLDADRIIRVVEQSIDNDKPIITGTPGTRTSQNASYRFEPVSSDTDGDKLKFEITNKPSWATFDTGTGVLSGTPGNQDVGTTRGIKIAVDDQTGQPNSVASLPVFDIEVVNTNDSPTVVTAIGVHRSAQAAPLPPLDVSSHFLDPDGDALPFSISGLPAGTGLGISASGVISGTPTYEDARSSPVSVTVTASDPSGASVSDTFTLLVEVTDRNNDGIPDNRAIALGLDPDDPAGDTDKDGIPDSVEVDNLDSPLDQDNDGIIDALEPGAAATDPALASGLSLTGGVTVSLSTAGGERLSQVIATGPATAPTGITFPFGAISYLTTSPVGGSVTVSMEFSGNLPGNTVLYKLDHTGGYSKLPAGVWTKKDQRTIELTLRDGDPQTDLDGIANGIIDDPVAVGDAGSPPADSGSQAGGGGGGGCTLNAANSEDPLFLLIALASLLGLSTGRRRKVGTGCG